MIDMSVNMIDEKLDFALAGLLGWVNWWDGVRLIWVDGATNEFRRKVTDWHPSSDPAASLEIQVAACEVDASLWARNMLVVRGMSTKMACEIRHLALPMVAQLCNASPRERAEAAYMTLSSHPLREDI
jgi:hypothetical protein